MSIAADATAHLVWNSANLLAVSYCTLPPGSGTCTPTPMPVTDNAAARPYAFASGSAVQVLTNRCCTGGSKTLVFTSANGGQNFGGPATVGTLNPSGDAALGPGNGLSLVTSALISSYFQRVPTDGSGPAAAEIPLSNQYTYHGSVAVTGDRPLVAFDDLTRTAFTRTNGGDPNVGSSWPAPAVVGDGVEPHFANGPAGLFLLTRKDRTLQLWKFDGSAFQGPTTVNQAANPIGPAAIAQDPEGHLHVVWREGDGNPTSLMYTSSADGAGWAVPVPVAQETSIQGLRLAAGPGGQGLAIWDRGSAGNMVRAARVPPPPPPPPSPGPTAAFTYAPHDVCNGLITFDASGSQPAGAPIVDYRWVMHDVGVAEVGGWFNPVSVEVVPYTHDVDSGGEPRTTWRFDWAWVSHKGDNEIASFARPDVDVDLTVTDATGATGTTTGTVRFLYEQADFSQTLKCPPRVDVVGPLRMAPTASVAANGTVTVIGACPSGSPVCLGSLVLRRTSTASSSARRRRASRAVLARTKFAVPPAHRMRLKLRLNRRGRALMRHHRRLVVRAVTSGAAFGDAARPRSSRLTLVRKKRR